MENEFNFPNFAGQANALREKLRNAELLRKTPPFADNEEKEPVVYYKCVYHKKIFCYDCAHNFGKREIAYYLAPKCDKYEVPQKDCIWEKFILDKTEIKECSWCKKEITDAKTDHSV